MGPRVGNRLQPDLGCNPIGACQMDVMFHLNDNWKPSGAIGRL